jgi:hypothetical protein
MNGSKQAQETTPAKGKPVEIHIPTRDGVLSSLGNVIEATEDPSLFG